MNRIETITLHVGHVGHVVEVEVTPLLESVIEVVRKVQASGATKVASVRRIYPEIADQPRESFYGELPGWMNLL